MFWWHEVFGGNGQNGCEGVFCGMYGTAPYIRGNYDVGYKHPRMQGTMVVFSVVFQG